jgi:uncharacterized protein GlcG (DUF336 family)
MLKLRCSLALAIVGMLCSVEINSQVSSVEPTLSSDDVAGLLRAGATSIGVNTLSVAVVDRGGRILGVLSRPGASAVGPDAAVTTARAAAMFSNAEAPLSTRTVRFISGIHFPPGVPNTSNAALYGIENSNRGCQLNAADTHPIGAPRSIAGSGLASAPAAACRPSDQSGCAIGGPITINRTENVRVGFSTGKNDVLDIGAALDVPVNPGGFAVYRNGRVAGAVGVSGLDPDQAEYAAFVAAASVGGLSALPSNPLPSPGAVFIDGLRLPFFAACTSVSCVEESIRRGPPRASAGTFSESDIRVPPRAGRVVPTGYLLGPVGSAGADGLTEADVRRIVDQGVARALVTRAQIRLPLTQPARMVIAVSDQAGELLAAFRMDDSTVFSFDVAVTKARNAYYFSSREGYEVLRSFVRSNPYDSYEWEPEPPAGQGWAITNRTLGFGGQPLFPPGIDLEKPPTPGPWFDLFLYDSVNTCTEGPGPSRGGNRQYLNQSGIVWFPGSAPLYKNGRLVGGVGVSGDGVEQDDYVTASAVTGFDAPVELRVDNSSIRTRDGMVRLPYWKFPRNPELR